jgi:hypothetical protein
MKRLLIIFLAGLISGLSLTTSAAPRTLDAKEITELFTDKTAHTEIKMTQDKKYLIYYGKDGKVIMKAGDTKTDAKWRVSEDGKHCLSINNRERCATVIQDNTGVYYRVMGKNRRVHAITSFSDGNIIK